MFGAGNIKNGQLWQPCFPCNLILQNVLNLTGFLSANLVGNNIADNPSLHCSLLEECSGEMVVSRFLAAHQEQVVELAQVVEVVVLHVASPLSHVASPLSVYVAPLNTTLNVKDIGR